MEMEAVGTRRGRRTGEDLKTAYPRLKPRIVQAASPMAGGVVSARTELKNQTTTTAGGRGRLTGQTRTTLTDKGIVGRQTSTRGEEDQGHPKKWAYCGIIPLFSKMEIWSTNGLGRSSQHTHSVPLAGSRPPRKTPPVTQDPKGGRDKAKVKGREDRRKVILWNKLGNQETSAWHCTGKTARYVINRLVTSQ